MICLLTVAAGAPIWPPMTLAHRNVEVYGAITLRTDGRTPLLAFRMERMRQGRTPRRWQTYAFCDDPVQGIVAVSE